MRSQGELILVDFVRRRRLIPPRHRIHVMSFDYEYNESIPRIFKCEGKTVFILEVSDRWLARDHRYFKVRAVDSSVYILRHDLRYDEWSLAN